MSLWSYFDPRMYWDMIAEWRFQRRKKRERKELHG